MHRFLKQMGEAAPDEHYWNVSLFHYRNHGADFGRVLVGVQVSPEAATDFEDCKVVEVERSATFGEVHQIR